MSFIHCIGGGGGGLPIIYGTTDPSGSTGSDGQLYAKYRYISACEVVVSIYKPVDATTVSITITENGDTVYTASPSCSIFGEYSEITDTITLSTGTYVIKYWGEEKQEPSVESQFVRINGNTVGFVAQGSNSSYHVEGSKNLEVEQGGNVVANMWLKISSEWCPINLYREE